MREILFRGKRVDNGEWLEGRLTHGFNGADSISRNMQKPGVYASSVVDSETIGQYTGLKDREGNRIFEGDIIVWGYSECLNHEAVAYGDDAMFQTETSMLCRDTMKVVGNIYDNPMLIEGLS